MILNHDTQSKGKQSTYQLNSESPIAGNSHTLLAGHGDNATSIVLQDALRVARGDTDIAERAKTLDHTSGGNNVGGNN